MNRPAMMGPWHCPDPSYLTDPGEAEIELYEAELRELEAHADEPNVEPDDLEAWLGSPA